MLDEDGDRKNFADEDEEQIGEAVEFEKKKKIKEKGLKFFSAPL